MSDTDRQYARKRPGLAWHIIAFHTRGLNTWLTICGRTVFDPTVDVLPWNDDPCGSCLRIFNRQVDPPEDDPTTSPVDPVTDTP